MTVVCTCIGAIDQLPGEAGRACLTDPAAGDSGPPGYCYIDPSLENGDGEFLAGGGIADLPKFRRFLRAEKFQSVPPILGPIVTCRTSATLMV